MNDTVLVADVGGTRARFALVDRELLIHERRVLSSPEFASAEDLVDAYVEGANLTGRLTATTGSSIAVAGPVIDGRGELTNGTLVFDATALARRFGPSLVMNDFVAASLGVPHVGQDALATIGGGTPRRGTKAVIGPGTGLGMGILLPAADGYHALPSEGGHGDLASTDPLEHEVYQALGASFGFVSWETVLSGPGLLNLYRAVCLVWDATPESLEPKDITTRAHDAQDPVCHQTVEIFCSLLGSAAGNLALTVCAEGGVYLCGRIVAGLTSVLAEGRFRRRFETRGLLTEYMKPISTQVVQSDDLGLVGAAAAFWQHAPVSE